MEKLENNYMITRSSFPCILPDVPSLCLHAAPWLIPIPKSIKTTKITNDWVFIIC